jgi:hypothetical protein
MSVDEQVTNQQAAEKSAQATAEITALAAEFNQKVKEIGARVGVSLVTEIEIKILPKGEEQ